MKREAAPQTEPVEAAVDDMEASERVTTFLTREQKERFKAECQRAERSELRQTRVLIMRWFDELDAQRKADTDAATTEPSELAA